MAELTLDQQKAIAIAKARLRAQQAAQAAANKDAQPSNYGRAIGSGLMNGVADLVGGIGDAANITGNAVSGAASFLGAPEWLSSGMGTAARGIYGPAANITGDMVRGGMRSVAGDVVDYQPQGRGEQIAQTAGRFAPSAIVGPGGLATKGAAYAGGVLGHEGVDYVADRMLGDGHWLTPYLRAGGAMLGAGTAAGVADVATAPVPKGLTRGSAQLLKQALPDDNFANYQKLGPDAMVMDAGPSTVGLAQGVVVTPGRSTDDLTRALVGRDLRRTERLVKDTESILGRARDPVRAGEAIDKAALRKAGPMYEALKKAAPSIPPDAAPSVAFLDKAINLSAKSRKAFNSVYGEIDDALKAGQGMATGGPELVARRLHDLRKSLDDRIAWDKMAFDNLSSADKASQAVLKEARKSVDELLKRYAGFDVPDAIIEQAKRAQDDMKFGFDSLEGGKTAMWPETMAKEMADRAGKAKSYDSRKMIAEGQKARIKTAMGTQSNDLAALKKMLGGDADFNRDKIAMAQGSDKVQRLLGSVDRESEFARNSAAVLANSQTARRQAGQKLVDAMDAPRVTGQETVAGLGLRAGAGIGNALLRGMTKRLDQSGRQALADALGKSGPEGLAIMQAVAGLPSAPQRAIVRALIAGLASRNAP